MEKWKARMSPADSGSRCVDFEIEFKHRIPDAEAYNNETEYSLGFRCYLAESRAEVYPQPGWCEGWLPDHCQINLR